MTACLKRRSGGSAHKLAKIQIQLILTGMLYISEQSSSPTVSIKLSSKLQTLTARLESAALTSRRIKVMV